MSFSSSEVLQLPAMATVGNNILFVHWYQYIIVMIPPSNSYTCLCFCGGFCLLLLLLFFVIFVVVSLCFCLGCLFFVSVFNYVCCCCC